jgi:dynein heavy chain
LTKQHDNANALVTGLSSSKIRWNNDVDEFNIQYGLLDGNVLLSQTFFSYLGAFPSEYRDGICKETMKPLILQLKIACNPKWKFVKFQASDMDVKSWIANKLPTDEFSQQNGVLAMQARRWPLMIDPQI